MATKKKAEPKPKPKPKPKPAAKKDQKVASGRGKFFPPKKRGKKKDTA